MIKSGGHLAGMFLTLVRGSFSGSNPLSPFGPGRDVRGIEKLILGIAARVIIQNILALPLWKRLESVSRELY